MHLELFIERENTTQNIEFQGSTVLDLFNLLAINPETVIAVRNGEVITEQEILKDREKIELLSVISGG